MAKTAYVVRFNAAPDDVTLWLEEQFARLGFNDLQVWILASRRRDWQLAERLVDNGCDVDVAFDILA